MKNAALTSVYQTTPEVSPRSGRKDHSPRWSRKAEPWVTDTKSSEALKGRRRSYEASSGCILGSISQGTERIPSQRVLPSTWNRFGLGEFVRKHVPSLSACQFGRHTAREGVCPRAFHPRRLQEKDLSRPTTPGQRQFGQLST